MFKIFFAGLLFFSSVAMAKIDYLKAQRLPTAADDPVGNSQVVLQSQNNWLRIEGASAKALYKALKAAAKNNQGEAGSDIYFKEGKSYQCWMDQAVKTDTGYVCVIPIEDPSTGVIK